MVECFSWKNSYPIWLIQDIPKLIFPLSACVIPSICRSTTMLSSFPYGAILLKIGGVPISIVENWLYELQNALLLTVSKRSRYHRIAGIEPKDLAGFAVGARFCSHTVQLALQLLKFSLSGAASFGMWVSAQVLLIHCHYHNPIHIW